MAEVSKTHPNSTGEYQGTSRADKFLAASMVAIAIATLSFRFFGNEEPGPMTCETTYTNAQNAHKTAKDMLEDMGVGKGDPTTIIDTVPPETYYGDGTVVVNTCTNGVSAKVTIGE